MQDLSKEFSLIKSSHLAPEDKLSLLCVELDSKIELHTHFNQKIWNYAI
jgi:hypothetical protein